MYNYTHTSPDKTAHLPEARPPTHTLHGLSRANELAYVTQEAIYVLRLPTVQKSVFRK
jgi:hypothetical protein